MQVSDALLNSFILTPFIRLNMFKKKYKTENLKRSRIVSRYFGQIPSVYNSTKPCPAPVVLSIFPKKLPETTVNQNPFTEKTFPIPQSVHKTPHPQA